MRSRSASAAAKSRAARRPIRSSASLLASASLTPRSSLVNRGRVAAPEEHQRATLELLALPDLAEEDRVVATLEHLAHAAVEPGHHAVDHRRAGLHRLVAQAVELVVALLRERHGQLLLPRGQDVDR